jgi:hypothetical protein
LTFDLGFSIKYRQVVFLNDYDVSEALRDDAKNCLVLLVGGHRIIVKLEKREVIYLAKVYLYLPVRVSNCYDDVGDKRLQSVNKVMASLSQGGFDSEYLKSVLPDVKMPERVD